MNDHQKITKNDVGSFSMLGAVDKAGFQKFERLDLVRIGSGHRLIVIEHHPNRPANPWTGVLEGGKGAIYKFGYKHNPVKIGTVTENHPAIQAMNARTGDRLDSAAESANAHGLIKALVDGTLRGDDPDLCRALASKLRTLGY